jgi:hypothetical protein
MLTGNVRNRVNARDNKCYQCKSLIYLDLAFGLVQKVNTRITDPVTSIVNCP